MTESTELFSLVVPVLNEEDVLDRTYAELTAVLARPSACLMR